MLVFCNVFHGRSSPGARRHVPPVQAAIASTAARSARMSLVDRVSQRRHSVALPPDSPTRGWVSGVRRSSATEAR